MYLKLQPSAYTDHITAHGEELQALPRPYAIDGNGLCVGPNPYKGKATGVSGFQVDAAAQQIDVLVDEAFRDPSGIVGMYAVMVTEYGQFFTSIPAIANAELIPER
ncbi:hypothetical protein [Streptomyces sp. NBC_01197]|uniref:hypothetical protein n=1 Tax=Streptomyces sp. NBC_01197 TaxID=2903768 RepID=UPI002E0F6CBA|nr:hypothetical protein OG452_05435 [Streptomyces sp. NBC_01197]